MLGYQTHLGSVLSEPPSRESATVPMTDNEETNATESKLSPRDRAIHDLTKSAEKLSSHKHKHRGFGAEIDATLGAAFEALGSALTKLRALPVDVKPARPRGQREMTPGAIYKVRETSRGRLCKILGLPEGDEGAAMVIFLERLDGSEILVMTGSEKRVTLKTSDLDGEVIAA